MGKIYLCLLLLVVLSLFSCEKSVYMAPNLPDTVSFKRDITPIFNTYCNSSTCHGGSYPQSNFNLEPSVAYKQLWEKSMIDTIHPENSVLYAQMNAGTKIMPPSGRIDSFYVREVLKWIQQKAKNN